MEGNLLVQRGARTGERQRGLECKEEKMRRMKIGEKGMREERKNEVKEGGMTEMRERGGRKRITKGGGKSEGTRE